MFNIGTPELLLILVIALVVVGPRKLPEIARTIGRAINQLKKAVNSVEEEISGIVEDEKESDCESDGEIPE